MTEPSSTRTCPICGRSLALYRPNQEYCSFTCAGKAGITIDQILARSLAALGEQAREEQRVARSSQAKPATFAPPTLMIPKPPVQPAASTPAIIQPSLPDAEDEPPSRPPALQSSVIPYDGDITKDSASYRDAGIRNDLLTSRLLAREDTLVLAGFGAGLRVEHDALVVTEGRTHHPQSPLVHRLYRGVHAVARIVCLDPQGSLSFAAAKWCRDESITVVLLDRDGALLSTLTPNESADAALRRAQYVSRERSSDVPIVRELLRRKFAAQLDTVMSLHTEFLESVRAMDMLKTAISWFSLETPPPWLSSIDQLRTYEGRAAAAYFSCWRSFRVRWARGDVRKVPPHWLSFDGRSSPITARGLPRKAIDPVNACLNYAYGVLESGVRQALTSQGFDVACGFLHTDLKGRDSLVYDEMEPLRGTVDGLVLRLLSSHVLHYGDITKVNDGSCRLHPQLARLVVAACKLPQDTIEAQATWLRETLVSAL